MEYMKFYKLYHEELEKRTLQCIDDNIDHIVIYDKLMAFQFWLSTKLTPIYSLEYSRKNPGKFFVQNYYTNNLLSASTSVHAIHTAMYGQSIVHMRVILETLVKMFYLLIHPDETIYVAAHDAIKLFSPKYDSQRRKERLQQFLTTTKSIYGEHTIDEIEGKITHKYSFGFYVNQLYNKTCAESIFEQFSKLSEGSHGNFMNIPLIGKSLWEYDKDLTRTLFRYLQPLLFFNIVTVIDSNKDVITQDVLNDCQQFFQQMKSELGSNGMINTYFPNSSAIGSWKSVFFLSSI